MRLALATVLSVSTLAACSGWEQGYGSVDGVVGDLRDGGLECRMEGGDPDTGVAYAAEAGDCLVGGGDAFYTVALYVSEAQQDDARDWLHEINPGTGYVWGDGWSVSVPHELGHEDEVMDALGGEYVPPGG